MSFLFGSTRSVGGVTAVRIEDMAGNVRSFVRVDHMAMAISLVPSTRGLARMPAYARNLLPPTVVSRPLEGQLPTIELAIGYTNSNTSLRRMTK